MGRTGHSCDLKLKDHKEKTYVNELILGSALEFASFDDQNQRTNCQLRNQVEGNWVRQKTGDQLEDQVNLDGKSHDGHGDDLSEYNVECPLGLEGDVEGHSR